MPDARPTSSRYSHEGRAVTCLPEITPGQKKLGLVIDLDTCVGCQACATNCKEWNTSGHSAPLPDLQRPIRPGPRASGSTASTATRPARAATAAPSHFPRSCLHCETPACVTVCPTGASYKRDRGRHRPGRPRHLHRLRPLRLGLPLWRARDGRGRGGDEEMHPLRRPHLQRDHPRGAAPAGLRADLPDQCPPLRRPRRPGQRRSASWSPSAAART